MKEITSLADVKKPAEAEDKCWKCKGEEDVDKVSSLYFCDYCQAAWKLSYNISRDGTVTA